MSFETFSPVWPHVNEKEKKDRKKKKKKLTPKNFGDKVDR